MTNHTPAPWTIRTTDDPPAYHHYHIEPNVAEVFYTNATGEANARLIAAAPDLLAALEAISAALDRVGYPMAIRAEVNAMDAAIAKAIA